MKAAIQAIEYYLPEKTLTTEKLATEFPDWSAEKIDRMTGISERHIAAVEECASDLGVEAARKLFAAGAIAPAQVDYLLFCTQSPDHFLPTTACLMQTRLNLPVTVGALDFNLGHSGFVYGLGLAQGLIETGQVSNVLLITAETYSKFIHPRDRSVRMIFGDAAAATLVRAVESTDSFLGPYVYGTDGSGAASLIVPAGGMREPRTVETSVVAVDEEGNERSRNSLFMNGGEVFTFTLSVVPNAMRALLARADKTMEEIDLFVFHQANAYILEHLRKRMHISSEKFYVALSHCGNTVSSTIPIALKHAQLDGRLRSGQLVMLIGFGVGYSWSGTLLRWI
jgi:3-oxoacyl-[acyl-carrier-protein] synthase-3